VTTTTCCGRWCSGSPRCDGPARSAAPDRMTLAMTGHCVAPRCVVGTQRGRECPKLSINRRGQDSAAVQRGVARWPRYHRVMATPANDKMLLAEAAEHLVISRLLRLGYPSSQAPRTWRADDVFIDQGPSFQVKATDKGLSWLVGNVRQNERQFYALVDFRERLAPVVYVLSNADIRKVIEAAQEASIAGHPDFKDIGMRKLQDPWPKGCEPPKYPNGWLQNFEEQWQQLPEPVRAQSAES
jgi:hypothetical protein